MFDALKSLYSKVSNRSILSLFDDPNRAVEFSVRFDHMLFDYSKTNIDKAARAALLDLARDRGVAQKRDAMFQGAKINDTEGRAVLHTALRNLDGDAVQVDGQDVMPEVLLTLTLMGDFAEAVRGGDFVGQGGRITDVVNIGIGGSDLGPAMATLALAPYNDGPKCHFVSNVDGAHISDVLRDLNPETTLVIVASKTFTTIETMTNARTARAWMSERVATPAAQFAALSTAADKTSEFGIDTSRVFGFADWGGVIINPSNRSMDTINYNDDDFLTDEEFFDALEDFRGPDIEFTYTPEQDAAYERYLAKRQAKKQPKPRDIAEMKSEAYA
ncbi:MAG: hypothetical protein ACO3RM_08495, partial [Paracoccaceae bacterium]